MLLFLSARICRLCIPVGLEGYGVDVLTVLPWFIATPMTESMKGQPYVVSTQSFVSEMVSAMQLRRCGTVFVPQGIKLLELMVNSMPAHQRTFLMRLAGKALNPQFTQDPG